MRADQTPAITLDAGTNVETLVDALDVLLEKGVVLQGDVQIGVAEVALVRAGLRLHLSGVRAARERVVVEEQRPMVADEHAAVGAPTGRESPVTPRDRELDVGNAPTRIGGRPEAEVSSPASKEASAGESNPALGLAELVLLLVDVLRRLLERQAMRRVEDGDVSDERIERLGLTFAELEEQVREQLSRMRER